jgi:hypothetical protein
VNTSARHVNRRGRVSRLGGGIAANTLTHISIGFK